MKSLAVVIGLATLGVGAGQPPRAGRPMGPRRLMMIANYNNDIAAYWKFSGYGYYPIDLSNEAYKFGVNYVMYALTH